MLNLDQITDESLRHVVLLVRNAIKSAPSVEVAGVLNELYEQVASYIAAINKSNREQTDD